MDYSPIIIALISAFGLITVALLNRQDRKLAVVKEVPAKIDEVHTLVNSKMSAALAKIESLEAQLAALQDGGRAQDLP